MKHILKKVALLAALIVGMVLPMTAQSTYVHVTIYLNDGTEAYYDMQSSSYMYFEEGVKLVITEGSDGLTTVSYPLADIRKITCEEVEGALENASSNIAIYPSPAHDVLHFRNVEGKHNVRVYALDGRLVMSLQITGNESIDISDLPTGMYLVNIGYTTLKMMKL